MVKQMLNYMQGHVLQGTGVVQDEKSNGAAN
jgi:hypothetical protein